MKSTLLIPESSISIFSQVVKSIPSDRQDYGRYIKSKCSKMIVPSHEKSWDGKLDSLSVQSIFKDSVALEPKCRVWSRILLGLPSGQLSFLLCAGTDILPTSLNSRRWCFKMDASCELCGFLNQTVHHILSCRPTALNQGSLTWRHKSDLKKLVNSLNQFLNSDQSIYADLPGWLSGTSPSFPPSQYIFNHR